LAKQPETVEPLVQLVKSYLGLKQPDKAIKKLNEIIKSQPKNFVAYNLLGSVYGNEKKLDEATKAYSKAIELKPDWPNPYRNLALIYYVQKNKDGAIKLLNTGIEKTKGASELITDLAMIYQKDGEQQKILALYEDAYKQNPNSAMIVNNLASSIADYATDAASLERARKLAEPLAKANNPDMLDTVAWIDYKLGDYDKALPTLQKALAVNPESAIVNYHIGMVYFKKGDKEHAREHLKKAVDKNQEFVGLNEAKETLKSLG